MMRTVKLEVARCHEFPEGSAVHGYELHLPLRSDGKIDHDSWPRYKYNSDFRRFWGSEEERGRIKHGSNGWKLSFAGNEPEEVIFRADSHRFMTGDYDRSRSATGSAARSGSLPSTDPPPSSSLPGRS